jgi:hypothetical protein
MLGILPTLLAHSLAVITSTLPIALVNSNLACTHNVLQDQLDESTDTATTATAKLSYGFYLDIAAIVCIAAAIALTIKHNQLVNNARRLSNSTTGTDTNLAQAIREENEDFVMLRNTLAVFSNRNTALI